MKYAADFRLQARQSLTGRWGVAIGSGLVASVLGAISSGGIEFNTPSVTNSDSSGESLMSMINGLSAQETSILTAIAVCVLIVALVISIAYIFIGGIVAIGYSKFNLDLVDNQSEPQFNTLFGYFRFWKTAVAARILQGLYIFLWTLLFIIPGILAAYNYAMTSYILAEHPELTASQALAHSKTIMYGNRWRLFCLEFSFIGWGILCALTLGVGMIWLVPYQQASYATFYREISAPQHSYIPQAEEDIEP